MVQKWLNSFDDIRLVVRITFDHIEPMLFLVCTINKGSTSNTKGVT